jgi:hypothetical protein
VGFFNPQSGEHETFSHKGDTEAQERMAIKLKAKGARRAIRYKRFGAKKPVALKKTGTK